MRRCRAVSATTSARTLVPAVALLRRNRDFRLLFTSSVVSLMGDWFSQVAVAGLVTEVTGSPAGGAVVFAASVLPVFAVSPLAGVLADRVDRRTPMVTRPCCGSRRRCCSSWRTSRDNRGWQSASMALIAALAAFFEPVVSAVTPTWSNGGTCRWRRR
ncbi:MAG: hypothetical protein GEU74_01280 [Nitriliruptorales bacterium]|nr:hypothetical protein [Nitriliruptorales bacterium]